MTMTDETNPTVGRVMLLAEPSEVDLDGEVLQGLTIETPTGAKFTVTEKSNGARFLQTLIALVRDPSMPRATVAPKIGLAELARDVIRDLTRE